MNAERSRYRIIVGGFLGLLPAGGVTWDYLQYPLGFALLGHDVYYVEDTRLWPVFQANSEQGVNCSSNVAHLAAAMDAFGLGDRWAYRDEVSGKCFGLSEGRVREVCSSADILVNISCSTVMRDEYLDIPVRILIDSDPMFTQVQYVTQNERTSDGPGIRELVDSHTHHFTFGENVDAPDCRVPDCGLRWRPTRQPICLDHWPIGGLPRTGDGAYTTVMNWTAAPGVLEFDGEHWGQKDVEFLKFIRIPRAVVEAPLAVVVGQTTGEPFPAAEARRHGWEVLDPARCVPDWRTYRRFIQRSRGEFSVAKQTYVQANTGWFSCRSACYLAAGRPVVTQDTGWSRHLPHGTGLLAFHDFQSAVDGLRALESEHSRHSRAAREIAEECFDSAVVLTAMLEQVRS